jgi:hypothetical protein
MKGNTMINKLIELKKESGLFGIAMIISLVGFACWWYAVELIRIIS